MRIFAFLTFTNTDVIFGNDKKYCSLQCFQELNNALQCGLNFSLHLQRMITLFLARGKELFCRSLVVRALLLGRCNLRRTSRSNSCLLQVHPLFAVETTERE